MDLLKAKNLQEMYERVKDPKRNGGLDIQFHRFYEWIQKDIALTLYTSNPTTINNSINKIKLSGF